MSPELRSMLWWVQLVGAVAVALEHEVAPKPRKPSWAESMTVL